MRFGAVQLYAGDNVGANVATIRRLTRQAATEGTSVVVLPEACLYRGDCTPAAVTACEEALLGPIAELAAELGIRLVVGGVWRTTEDPSKPANQLVVFNSDGTMAADYTKIHLFRLHDGEGVIIDDEAAYTTPGDKIATVRVGDLNLGLSICYDLRFPELYRALADAGADVLLVPANFSAVTGPQHWLPLLQARAVENLSWVVAPAQTGVDPTGFATHGHTAIIDPWGGTHQLDGEVEAVLTVDIEPGTIATARQRMQSPSHRRPDAYQRSSPTKKAN